jgi:hypothetical protein
MTQLVSLRCGCGAVRGYVKDASSANGNHLVCYCDDCQAFAHWLNRPDLLDAQGGTQGVQVAPARVKITHGREAIRCLRLSPKGLYRFYASCCRTPTGSMLGPRVPFIGVPSVLFESAEGEAGLAAFGSVVGWIQGRFAVGGAPAHADEGASLRVLAVSARKMLSWWLAGLTAPSPYFDPATRALSIDTRVLSLEERTELRERLSVRPG